MGESESGRVQVFDDEGVFITQWTFARAGDQYLSSMASSPDGILYMVYESELHIHSGETGEHLGNLSHPDGWGFSDVDVSPDGIITAFWYKNRDDVITFDPRGGILVLLREAVSGVTGDSELSAMVACGNRGETFTLGSFNSVVVVHDSEGSFIDRFGSDDIFTMPAAMDVDPRGRLWISDFGDLKVFDAHGNLVRDFDPGVSVSDMVIDQQGRLWGSPAATPSLCWTPVTTERRVILGTVTLRGKQIEVAGSFRKRAHGTGLSPHRHGSHNEGTEGFCRKKEGPQHLSKHRHRRVRRVGEEVQRRSFRA